VRVTYGSRSAKDADELAAEGGEMSHNTTRIEWCLRFLHGGEEAAAKG
jgi:hypothetical protein